MKAAIICACITLILACKKNTSHPTPINLDDLVINGVEINKAPSFVVGQRIRVDLVVPSNPEQFALAWTISPETAEELERGDSYIVFRTKAPGKYFLKVMDPFKYEESHHYSLTFIKADFRYELWGSAIENVGPNEEGLATKSPAGSPEWGTVTKSTSNGWAKDVAQPGELITYRYTDGKLTSGTLQYFVNYGADAQKYTDEYAKVKERMSEYTFTGEFNEWAGISDATLYKTDTARWGEAFALDYVNFVDHYETDRSYIEARMEFDNYNDSPTKSGSVLITYTKK